MMTAMNPGELLDHWLRRRLRGDALSWFDGALTSAKTGEPKAFALAFSLTSRKVGRAKLELSADELADASRARTDWVPSRWTTDQATRILLVLGRPALDPPAYVAMLDRLFAAADFGELVALYQALPILPHPEAHRLRAAEGLRSNMRDVFEAVAHRNPYPADELDETAWNQLVLKCLFVGSRVDPVVGIDRRANPALARMLWDYAQERRAAGRPVSPELWRCVGPFAEGPALDELRRLQSSTDPLEQRAARLALGAENDPLAGWAQVARTLDARETAT
jgi:hypothetical protein